MSLDPQPIRNLREPFEPRNIRRDAKGYPLTYDLMLDPDGRPMKVDSLLEVLVMYRRRCGICGDNLHKECAFIGGPEQARTGRFFTPALHVDCARFAFEICPFISNPKWKAHSGMKSERPDEFVVYVTDGYKILHLRNAIVTWLLPDRFRHPWKFARVKANPATRTETHEGRRAMLDWLNAHGGCPEHAGQAITGCPAHDIAAAAAAGCPAHAPDAD